MPARLNPDASSSRKMLELYCLLLFSGRRYTLSTLAERLQCSKTTIERLMREIEVFDEVELGKDGKERWYQIKRLCNNKKVQIMYEHIQQISLCKDFASCVLPEGLKKEIEKTVTHTAEFIADDNIRTLSLQPMASASAKGIIDYTPFQNIITTIMQAIPKKIICEVGYHSPNLGKRKEFTIAPMHLLSYHNAIYLECWRFKQEDSKDILQPMTLAVQRIESFNPTKKRHTIDELPQSNNGNFGLIKTEKLKVVVRFNKDVALYVSERIWSLDQNITMLPSGAIELTYTANGIEETISWVLGFGDKAEVLEPTILRDAVIEILASLLKKYNFCK